jgi:hypothetical protein
VDQGSQTVHLQISGKALGIAKLKGATVYVTTWDYDGGYRPLQPMPDPYKMSGGDGATDPLIMDDVPVMTIPGTIAPAPGLHRLHQEGRNATGMLCTPRMSRPGRQRISSSGTARRRSGRRLSKVAMPICPSSLASGAPRQ